MKFFLSVIKFLGYILFPCATKLRLAEIRIEELEKELELAHKRAGQDPLTLLANRYGLIRHFIHTLGALFRTKEVVSVAALYIDLDGFKAVNDTFGHSAGDQVLRDVSNILRSVFRRETDIIARLGGDEFVVLIIGSSQEEAIRYSQEINTLMDNSPTLAFDKIKVTASIGISYREFHREMLVEKIIFDLLESGDRAMYEEKKSKTSTVSFQTT